MRWGGRGWGQGGMRGVPFQSSRRVCGRGGVSGDGSRDG